MKTRSQLLTLSSFKQFSMRRGLVFGLILLLALLAFEVFNYSTTDFALTDLLGENLRFLGLRWATILSIAFCGIDFAGIARLFTPEQGRDEPGEVWYLFAAWLLAATMNASLTWWGVAVAVQNHQTLGSSVVGSDTMFKVVPVFVAIMVWLIRVLIIGTFSMSGDRLFSFGEGKPAMLSSALRASRPATFVRQPRPVNANLPAQALRPVSAETAHARPTPRPEPSYHPVAMSTRANIRSSYNNNEVNTNRTSM